MIRFAARADLPAMVAIYNEAVAARYCGDLTPVTVAGRTPWFEEHGSPRYPILVDEAQKLVTGWCALSAYRGGRAAFQHTAEISYYVGEKYRRQGIASALLSRALKEAQAQHLKNVFAVVLEHNEPSCQLLRKFGFAQWGFLPAVADFGDVERGHLYFGLRLS